MNTWIGSGRLARDPEVRYTQAGKCVCRLNIAVDDGYGDNKRTYFIPVTVWDKFGEVCSRNLVKGQMVTISGRLTQHSYEKDGAKRSSIEVVAREVEFGEKPRGNGGASGSTGVFAGVDVDDSDIPF